MNAIFSIWMAIYRESRDVLTKSVTDSPRMELEYRFNGRARSVKESGSWGGLEGGSRSGPTGIRDSMRSKVSLIWLTSLGSYVST